MNKKLFIVFLLVLNACVVSKTKFNQQKALADKLMADKTTCLEEKTRLFLELDSVAKELYESKQHIGLLQQDSIQKYHQLSKLKKMYDDLMQLYTNLNDETNDLKQYSSQQKDLQQQAIKQREKAIELLKQQIELVKNDIANFKQNESELNKELSQKGRRILELENSLHIQDSLLKNMKTILVQSLKGYNDSVLSVTEKNGKLYVTISDKLLFKQGSTQVDEAGIVALKTLSSSLEKTNDYFVYIEGHTDSIPFLQKTGCIKDNWDLSVLRATNVLKILFMNDRLNKEKIIPCGRAELIKIASGNSSAQLSKNRRTEIILSPDYQKIFQNLIFK